MINVIATKPSFLRSPNFFLRVGLADIRLSSPQRYDHRGGKLISGSLDSLGLGSLSSFPYSQSLAPNFFF